MAPSAPHGTLGPSWHVAGAATVTAAGRMPLPPGAAAHVCRGRPRPARRHPRGTRPPETYLPPG